uniref:Uncharacterized protein n=1 Tax=Aegilops tauschii TaxID=37682 RepID=M8BHA9_AEGTA
MAQGGDAAACRCSLPLLPLPPRRLLLVVLVAMLTAVLVAAPSARAAWVEDYPSGVPCGATIPVEQCDPGDAAANSACMDVCHYGGGGASPGAVAAIAGASLPHGSFHVLAVRQRLFPAFFSPLCVLEWLALDHSIRGIRWLVRCPPADA